MAQTHKHGLQVKIPTVSRKGQNYNVQPLPDLTCPLTAGLWTRNKAPQPQGCITTNYNLLQSLELQDQKHHEMLFPCPLQKPTFICKILNSSVLLNPSSNERNQLVPAGGAFLSFPMNGKTSSPRTGSGTHNLWNSSARKAEKPGT